MSSKLKEVFKKLVDPRFLVRLPSLIKYRLTRMVHEKLLFRFLTKENVFVSIFNSNYWGNAESVSGPGSTLLQTAEIRRKMPIMFKEFNIHSVFDAPCGDAKWMWELIKDTDFKYVGADIVPQLIDNNRLNFQKDSVSFVKFDLTSDAFPDADVWLCRAVLYHFSNRDIYLALEKFLQSNIPYILTTNCVTDVGHLNKDINTGDWRSLNLMLPPFNFPNDPLWEVDDCTPPHPPMKLSLWSRKQIIGIMPSLREIFQCKKL